MVVCLGTLVVPFDSAVNVAFPAIIRAFALPIPAIQWVVIAYTLTYAALMLVFGRLGDMLGHRRVFLLGSGCSAVGLPRLRRVAVAMPWLLAARVAQGVGAALALSCGPALATGLYPESQRSRILGLYTMVFGVGGAAGSLLAGVLVQRFGWQSVFWFRAPLSLAAFVSHGDCPPRCPPARASASTPIGAGVAGAGDQRLIARAQSLAAGRQRGAVPGAVCRGGGRLRRARTPRRVSDHRSAAISAMWISRLLNAGHVMVSLAGFSVPLLVPFFLDRVAGLAAPQVGAMLAVSSLGTALAAPVAGRLAGRIAPRRLALAGAARDRTGADADRYRRAGAGAAGLRRLDVLARQPGWGCSRWRISRSPPRRCRARTAASPEAW